MPENTRKSVRTTRPAQQKSERSIRMARSNRGSLKRKRYARPKTRKETQGKVAHAAVETRQRSADARETAKDTKEAGPGRLNVKERTEEERKATRPTDEKNSQS